MKGKSIWIIGFMESVIGFIMFLVAQMEISSNSRYTWDQPYTSYEAKVILIKWVGVCLLISGIAWIGLKLYQARYMSNHIQEINQVTKAGAVKKCQACGLAITGNILVCPRCGKDVSQNNSQIDSNVGDYFGFCSKCGNKVTKNESFCPKCGQKITKE